MRAYRPQPIVVFDAANDGRPVRRIDVTSHNIALDIANESPAEIVARERAQYRLSVWRSAWQRIADAIVK